MTIRILALVALIALAFLLRPDPAPAPKGPVPHSTPEPSSTESAVDRTEIDAVLSRMPDLPQIDAQPATANPKSKPEFRRTPTCTSARVIPRILASPSSKHLRCLWDAKDVNPRRVYVSPEDRTAAEEHITQLLDGAVELRDLAEREAMLQFSQHVKSRATGLPFISRDDYIQLAKKRAPALIQQATKNGVLDPSAVGFMPAVAFDFPAALMREANGGWYGARIPDMSRAKPAFEAMAFLNLEIVNSLVGFATAYGTLTQHEAAEIRTWAYKRFEEMIQ